MELVQSFLKRKPSRPAPEGHAVGQLLARIAKHPVAQARQEPERQQKPVHRRADTNRRAGRPAPAPRPAKRARTPGRALVDMLNKCTKASSDRLLHKFLALFEPQRMQPSAERVANILVSKMLYHPQYDETYGVTLRKLVEAYPQSVAVHVADATQRMQQNVMLGIAEGVPSDSREFHAVVAFLNTSVHMRLCPRTLLDEIIAAALHGIRVLDEARSTDHARREHLLKTVRDLFPSLARAQQRNIATLLQPSLLAGLYDNRCKFMALDFLEHCRLAGTAPAAARGGGPSVGP
jgi:hypothetical protein